MTGDSMWWLLKPSTIDPSRIRPGAIIPCDPGDIIIMRLDQPPWEAVRVLLEDGDWP